METWKKKLLKIWTITKLSYESMDTKVETKVQEKIIYKSNYNLSFLIGKNLTKKENDYLFLAGIPITQHLNANIGFEFTNKIIFIGGTLNL